MQIHTVVQGGRALLTPDRGPTNRPEADLLCGSIAELAADGVADVVVDLKRAAWIGAAGIGALVCGLKAEREVGGQIHLTGVSRSVRRVLDAARVEGLFPVLAQPVSIQAAARAFSA